MRVDDASHSLPVVAHPSRASLAETFEEFFEAESDRLFGALMLVTRNKHESEELMQEAFLKVWGRWDRVRELESPTGYLYRVAMNEFRMRYRRTKVAARALLKPLAGRDPLEEAEVRSDVARALDHLGPRERAALVLTDLLGFSAADAANILHVKESTVRSLASHARASLHKRWPTSDE